MQACYRGWIVRKQILAEKQSARLSQDARKIADDSYVEATLVLVDDLLKDLTPTAMMWMEPRFTEADSIPNRTPTLQCSSTASACSGIDKFSSFDVGGLEIVTSKEAASVEQKGHERPTWPDFAVEQCGECCSFESTRGSTECDSKQVRRSAV